MGYAFDMPQISPLVRVAEMEACLKSLMLCRVIPAITPMKKNFLALVVATCAAVSMTGCYSTADGRLNAGVPFAKDTLESRYERPVAQIFAAAKDVLSFNGTLVSENTVNNTLEARVDTRRVWVRVDEVEPKVSRVIVQARGKGGGKDIDLASEIDKQIALRLAK